MIWRLVYCEKLNISFVKTHDILPIIKKMIHSLSPDCLHSVVPFLSINQTIHFSRTCKRFSNEIWKSERCEKYRLIVNELKNQSDERFGPGELGITEIQTILKLMKGKIKWESEVYPFKDLGEELVFELGCKNGQLVTTTNDKMYSYDPRTNKISSKETFPQDVYPMTGSNKYTMKSTIQTFKHKSNKINTTHIYWNNWKSRKRFNHDGPVALDEKNNYIIIASRIHFTVYSLDDWSKLFDDYATRQEKVKEPPVEEYKWTDAILWPAYWSDEDEKTLMDNVNFGMPMKKNRGKPAFIQRIIICDEGFCVIARVNRGGVPYDREYKTAYEWRIYYDNSFRRLGTYEEQVEYEMDEVMTSNINLQNPIITKEFVWDSIAAKSKLSRITEDGKLVDMKMFIKSKLNNSQEGFLDQTKLQLIPGTSLLAKIQLDLPGVDDMHQPDIMQLRIFHYRIRSNILELYELFNMWSMLAGEKRILQITDDLRIMALGMEIPVGAWDSVPAKEIVLIMGEIFKKDENEIIKDEFNQKNKEGTFEWLKDGFGFLLKKAA